MKKRLTLSALILLFYLLHQDFWWWNDSRPWVFGFLPVGLAYHAGYCVAAALLMWLLVRFAWPTELESLEQHQPPAPPLDPP